MFFLLLIILFIYVLLKFKKSLTFLILFLVLGLVCYFSKDLPDMNSYKVFYDSVANGVNSNFLGYGWLALCYIGNLVNLSYYEFKTIVYLLSLIFTFSAICKVTKKSKICFLVYLIFPGMLDIIQIRFFFATSIVVWSIATFLFVKKPKAILYLISIFLCSLIHNSCVFYLVFTIAPYIKRISTIKIFAIMILVTSLVFMAFSNYIGKMLTMILPASQAPRIMNYFNNDNTSIFGILIYSLLFLMFIVVFLCMCNRNHTLKQDKFKRILVINVLLLFAIPLVFISSDFMRIQRAILVLNYAVMIDYGKRISSNIKMFNLKVNLQRLMYFICILYFVLFMVMFNRGVFLMFL